MIRVDDDFESPSGRVPRKMRVSHRLAFVRKDPHESVVSRHQIEPLVLAERIVAVVCASGVDQASDAIEQLGPDVADDLVLHHKMLRAGPKARPLRKVSKAITVDFDLGGRVALVTGGNSGIGRAIALAFTAAGAAVFLASSASDFVTGVTIPVDGGYRIR